MSAESKYTKEFEDYWKTHEAALLRVAPKVLRDERANNGKMNTAGDWLLFIIPIMAMVGFMNTDFIKKELLRFLVAMLIGIACFVFSVYIKPYVTANATSWISTQISRTTSSLSISGRDSPA